LEQNNKFMRYMCRPGENGDYSMLINVSADQISTIIGLKRLELLQLKLRHYRTGPFRMHSSIQLTDSD